MKRTTKVITSPYLSPVYEYAMASIMGAYIPYVLFPTTYLAILTMVETIHRAINSSKIVCDTPDPSSHSVSLEVSNIDIYILI